MKGKYFNDLKLLFFKTSIKLDNHDNKEELKKSIETDIKIFISNNKEFLMKMKDLSFLSKMNLKLQHKFHELKLLFGIESKETKEAIKDIFDMDGNIKSKSKKQLKDAFLLLIVSATIFSPFDFIEIPLIIGLKKLSQKFGDGFISTYDNLELFGELFDKILKEEGLKEKNYISELFKEIKTKFNNLNLKNSQSQSFQQLQ